MPDPSLRNVHIKGQSLSLIHTYVFICKITKAIRLELVSELSTAALHRFISRGGCPSKVISDKGTNFKGATKHIKELIKLCRDERVQNFCSMKDIQWSLLLTCTTWKAKPHKARGIRYS